MSDSTMMTGLVSTWVSTVDSRGQAHLETRWVDPGAQAPVGATAPAGHPLVSHAGHAA